MLAQLVLAALAVAPQSSDGQPPRIAAVRAANPPTIDGRIDEDEWRGAVVLDHFVQRRPDEGAPATEPTEVRILYDERALYVAFRCFDSQPTRLRLGRRDALPESDTVWVSIDPSHDRHTAYLFGVNSAGVLADAIEDDTIGTNFSWDGVWTARTHVDEHGWSAELEIPFVTLRFPRAALQSWGFHVERYLSRRSESDDWNLIRESDATQVGRFAELDGVEGARPGLSLELSPYASATVRASLQPGTLYGRGTTVTPQAGFDFKYALSGSLTLDGTVNPDFGQVEVDPEVVNLSAYEVYFPEKRPFFLEGLDIFQSAGPLIYTRRIGAPPPTPDTLRGRDDYVMSLDSTARILGAAKLSGNLRPGTQVGVLSAWVDSTEALVHSGPGYLGDTYELEASPASLFNAARVRQKVAALSTVGATLTSVVRGGKSNATAAAVDYDLRTSGDFTASGGVSASWNDTCVGSDCDRVAGSLSIGKHGGEGRAWVDLAYTGAYYDPNDFGFFSHLAGNQLVGQSVHVAYYRPRPWKRLNKLTLDLSYATYWDPNVGDARTGTPMVDHTIKLDGYTRWRNNWEFGWFAFRSLERYDDAETRQNPKVRVYHRDAKDSLWLRLRSDDTRPLWIQLFQNLDRESGTEVWTPGMNLTALAGTHLQLATTLSWTQWFGRPRWIDTAADGLPLFGDLEMQQLEVDVSGTVAFTRALTLQLYTQLLRSALHYERVHELTDPRTFGPAMPGGGYDNDLTSLIINAIARWEFRPLSTLYVVYTHNQQVTGTRGVFDLAAAAGNLGGRPADNVIAVKLSYLWAL